jgi:hypothetical protein
VVVFKCLYDAFINGLETGREKDNNADDEDDGSKSQKG